MFKIIFAKKKKSNNNNAKQARVVIKKVLHLKKIKDTIFSESANNYF